MPPTPDRKPASSTMISALKSEFEFTSILLLSQTQPVPLRENLQMLQEINGFQRPALVHFTDLLLLERYELKVSVRTVC